MEIKGIFCNAFFGKNFVKVTTILLNETLRVDLTKSVFGGSKFFIFPHWGGSTNLKFFTLWDPFLWGRGVVVLLQTKCLLSRLAHVCLRVFGQMYHILKNTYCLHFGCKAITLLPFQNSFFMYIFPDYNLLVNNISVADVMEKFIRSIRYLLLVVLQ